MTAHPPPNPSSPRRRARRGSGEQLHGKILDAAKQLLAETGRAEAMSIRAVADVVGVTSPSIYLHFADKDSLVQAVVADLFGELGERLGGGTPGEPPLDKLCRQGTAYIMFALESPEHYRLATMSASTEIGKVDLVLQTTAFAHFHQTITECMDAGIFAKGDPTPVALDLWAAAHGIASLLIAKPYLPWGDVTEAADRVMRATAMGLSISEYLGADATPADFVGWRASLPPR
ncbi:TetR/AcrR family transcriptional regulator [Amycolatopsis minnesotensis]|uniref:TetR/AcrR family transcriptional regulator n=1 Tax=Amycolatopsis minnesotensis TaxID=337894 RepID=A0ABN2QK01_9PSEU